MTETIIEGCVLDVMPLMEAQSVHCCATSPPFFGLRDYGIEPSNWPAVSYAPMAGLPVVEVEAWTGCLGHEPTPEMYVGHLVAVFRLVRRVLRDDGTLWLNFGDSFASNGISGLDVQGATSTSGKASPRSHQRRAVPCGLKAKDLIGIPWRVAFALQADGWWLRSEVIWAKGVSFCESYAGSVMPESVTDRPSRSHEQVFLLTKKERYFYDHIAVQETAAQSTQERAYLGARPSGPQAQALQANGTHGKTKTLHDYSRSTRNLRSVWVINPEPSSVAHYAGWPSHLVAPMIRAGTSERGVCPACLAPYERVVERTRSTDSTYESRGKKRMEGAGPQEKYDYNTNFKTDGYTKTIGWRPTCSHAHPEPIPATVLDCFAGTGTTAETARRLGRHAILIDRSGAYIEMQRERLAQRELF